MRERAVQFGVRCTLTGILTEPEFGRESAAPAVIMLNSGILHRVGTCRLHVLIARALGEAGVTTLRFDFSGIGDSDVRRDTLPFEESAPDEVVEAMDYLAERKGITRFALFGLCSGADVGFMAAVRDPRVVGLCSLDAWPYKTLRQRLHHYAPRVISPAAWRASLKVRLERWRSRGAEPDTTDLELPTYVRTLPPRDWVAARLRDLVARGVSLNYVFSGGQEEYNYATQFTDAFRDVDFADSLQLCHLRDATHIFSGQHEQEAVIASTCEWVASLAASDEPALR